MAGVGPSIETEIQRRRSVDVAASSCAEVLGHSVGTSTDVVAGTATRTSWVIV